MKRWISFVTIVIILLFILLNRHGLLHLYRLRMEQKHMEVEIVMLRDRTSQLHSEVTKLENDLEYIERLAREKYRMVKRGEKVFRVVPQNPPTDQDAGDTTTQ
jgi:cell division protein FtsB